MGTLPGRAQASRVADDRQRGGHDEAEENDDPQIPPRDLPDVVGALGWRGREADRGEERTGNKHRPEAGAQIANLGVVHAVGELVEAVQRGAVPAPGPEDVAGPRTSPARATTPTIRSRLRGRIRIRPRSAHAASAIKFSGRPSRW